MYFIIEEYHFHNMNNFGFLSKNLSNRVYKKEWPYLQGADRQEGTN